MSAAVSEYELEALPELGAGYESEFEGDFESQQFFGALGNLARRGSGWMTAPGSSQRRLALSLARQALNRGLPTLRQTLGPDAADWLDGLSPQQEFEAELEGEFEISPIRRIYPDAMLEHLGHAAAATLSEAEAEALASAMIPLAAQIRPKAAPALMRAAPGLVSGISGLVQGLRRSPATQPLVRVVPSIVRRTAASVARQAAGGAPATSEAAVRMLAQQTLRVLGSPQQSARAFRRSRALDELFHRSHRSPRGGSCNCPACAAREPVFEFEAAQHPNCRELTPAQCRIVLQATSEAIKLANNAASKLDATLVFGPRTKKAQETANLFIRIFCHDPRTAVPWADNMPSGASVADRFRKVVRELRGSANGGRTITFRPDPICDDRDTRGFVVESRPNPDLPPAGERSVVHLCPPFWNPPPEVRRLPAEVFRGGVILHEMLHVLNPGWFAHNRLNTSVGGERRRNNANCYRAFALGVAGVTQDPTISQCMFLPRDRAGHRAKRPC
jgi:hypothetical protein